MLYDMPSNVTGFMDLVDWTSETVPLFGTVLLILVFFISFLSLKNYTNERAFAFATFFSLIVSVMLYVLGMVNMRVVIITGIGAAIGMVWLKMANSTEY